MVLNHYPLLSSPDIKVLDRFSLLNDDNDLSISEDPATGLVPLWPLLQSLLNPTITNNRITTFPELTSLLDTISVTLHGTSHPAGDYGLLREAITSRFQGRDDGFFFFSHVWPRLVQLALQMPALFPRAGSPS
ncbi:uncharacterized protein B0T15DRAFT_17022 [Chaetomium strumarium]|uniref:Uncharacterized protein n=1 Tax=Chaetomium strumarium TaxID=1170767 RepID=A0AAJ0H136_9PEZI|nr:hypothetical protein B0T15DRAFT_17022 [Chaetomium strumarium]